MILFTFYIPDDFPEWFFFKIFISEKLRECILFTFYFLGKTAGAKNASPLPYW